MRSREERQVEECQSPSCRKGGGLLLGVDV